MSKAPLPIQTDSLERESLEETEIDIRIFEEMFVAKVGFFDEVVANRSPGSSVNTRELRQNHVYDLAQFFCLLNLFGITNAPKLKSLAETHNEHLKQVLDDEEDMERLGVQPERLRNALFDTDEKLGRLVANCGTNGIRLSQADIERFMIECMSTETCRATIRTLCAAGYFHEVQSPYGPKLMGSTGKLEKIFHSYIRGFRKAIFDQ